MRAAFEKTERRLPELLPGMFGALCSVGAGSCEGEKGIPPGFAGDTSAHQKEIAVFTVERKRGKTRSMKRRAIAPVEQSHS